MLIKAFFDDSGTHGDSKVVVMGGLLGTVEQWKKFEREWADKLKFPLPGKPPLKKFHLAHCNAREGEFRGYSDAEQDAVIHDFRKIVIDAKLTSTASAIDREAWAELVVPPYRDVPRDALTMCFNNCISETWRIVQPRPDGHEIKIVFDQGIWTKELQTIGNEWTYPLGTPRVVSVTFASVADVLPLQGADIVATESYWHAAEWLKLGDAAKPRAHLRHYLDNMLSEGLILDRDGIKAYLSQLGSGIRPQQELLS